MKLAAQWMQLVPRSTLDRDRSGGPVELALEITIRFGLLEVRQDVVVSP